jgi:hypothetical protein
MRENLSLLSFWGLVFSLIAVTLFVVIYSYQKNKYANQNIVEDLRQRSVDTYLAAKTREAETDSKKSEQATSTSTGSSIQEATRKVELVAMALYQLRNRLEI